jgi:hypothetical protein
VCVRADGWYNTGMPKITFPKHWFAKRYAYRWLFVSGAVLLVAAGLLWWFRVQTDPERVFWGMLEQSMRTSGVTMQTAQEDATTSVDYTLQYSLGGENRAHSLTTIKQNGSEVTTEVIGTPEADYTRYAAIETSEKNAAGEPLDTSAIEGVWAKEERTAGDSGLIAQALLGLTLPLGSLPVPIAQLDTEQREAMLDLMRRDNVYKVDYDKVEKQRVNGRLQYAYDVQIQVIPYVNLMKQFAASTGLRELQDLDPNSYSGALPMQVQMVVDVRSRHLADVRFSAQGQEQHSSYRGYDVPVGAPVPEESIDNSELQRRLLELQNPPQKDE